MTHEEKVAQDLEQEKVTPCLSCRAGLHSPNVHDFVDNEEIHDGGST